MKVYVASSWRNEQQPEVVHRLGVEGHRVYDFRHPSPRVYDFRHPSPRVYDFRHPSPGDNGFHWSELDPSWQSWSPAQFRDALRHPVACRGFAMDKLALNEADAVVLVMPCGRSAHLELGYGIGKGKRGVILLSDGEPELMYRMAENVCVTLGEVVAALRVPLPATAGVADEPQD